MTLTKTENIMEYTLIKDLPLNGKMAVDNTTTIVLQKHLFLLGYKWGTFSKRTMNEDAPFIYWYSDGKVHNIGFGLEEWYFNEHKNTLCVFENYFDN